MPTEIGSIDRLELDNDIKLHESGEYYEAGNGLTRSRFYQSGNKVVISNGGEDITWVPSGIKYIDSSGMEDLVYTVQDVPMEAKANYVRYNRATPDVDDWFIQENGALKHQILVQGFHREPMPWLSGGIQFAVGGRLTFSDYLRVRADGLVIEGPFSTSGAIDIIDSEDRIIFTLPEIVVFDSRIPVRNSTTGGYAITVNEGGLLEFSVTVDNEWMTSSQQVYPIIIDPTVTVAATVSLGSAIGRTMGRLSNGWLVCTASAGTSGATGQMNFYKSTDKGQTWSQMFSITPSAPSGTNGGFGWGSPRIEVNGTKILISHILWNYTNGGTSGQEQGNNYLYFFKIDCTTVANSNQWGHASRRGPLVTRSSNRSDATYGGTAIHMGPDGVYHLLATLSPNNTSFSDSFNRKELLYGSSSDGGNTWTSMLRLTAASSSSTVVSFDINTNANGVPVVVYTYDGGSSGVPMVSSPAITSGSAPPDFPTWKYRTVFDGTFGVYPYVGGLVRDTDGVLWAFYGMASDSSASSYTVRAYTSSDSFNTISGGLIYTGDNKQIQVPTSTIDYTGAVTVIFGAGVNLFTMTRPYGGSWGSAVPITTSLSAGSYNAPALCDDTRFFGYIQSGSLICSWTFINHAPAAPINLTRGNYNATTAATYTWSFSDVNAGDVQSAAEVEIRRVSNGAVITTGKMSGSTQAYVAPANLLVNGQQYQWRVRTWDSYNDVGPWSGYATFWTAASPTATITSPTANQVIQTPSTVVNWGFSDPAAFPQAQYQVRVYNVSGVVVWDSGLISSPSARNVTTGNVLGNGQQYRITVVLYNDKGVASNAAEVWINISYIAPPAPEVTILPMDRFSRVSIVNPASSDPSVQYNDIYRREQGQQEWVRIATQIPASGWEYVAGQLVSEANFVGKITGSVVENANISKNTATTSLTSPLVAWFAEETNTQYTNLASLNGAVTTHQNSSNGNIIQNLFSFDLIQHTIRKWGADVFGAEVTTAERVTWLKANITRLAANWYGFGSGPAGNKATFAMWNVVSLSYATSGDRHESTTSGAVTKLPIFSTPVTVPQSIDDNGFMHAIAYADASDGVTASTINTDFVELEVTLAGINVAVPSTFDDYTVKSGVIYEYQVVAVGSNGAPASSDIASGVTDFSGVVLYDVSDPAGTICTFAYDGGGKSHSWEPESAMMQFQGREAPVVEFGRSESTSVTFTIDMARDREDLNKLSALVRRKAILCYRDGRGVSVFGVVQRLPYTDEIFGYTASVEVLKVSYTEEV